MADDGYSYFSSGLSLKSDRPIPGLPPRSPDGRVDVRISFGERPRWACEDDSPGRLRYESADIYENGTSVLKVVDLEGRGQTRFDYGDGTVFLISKDGSRVWAQWVDPFTLEDVVTYLLGPIIGWLLRLRGVIPLHASSVAFNSQAIAFVGPGGAGKSTIAAAFAEWGFPVVADDVLALRKQGSRVLAEPGYPLLRLWPDSAESLFGSADSLPLMTPNWSKRYLDLTQAHYTFVDRPLPLSVIYILKESPTGKDTPLIDSISGSAALMALAANTCVNYLLNPAMRACEFAFLGDLTRSIPIRRIFCTRYSDRAVLFHGAIWEDARALIVNRK